VTDEVTTAVEEVSEQASGNNRTCAPGRFCRTSCPLRAGDVFFPFVALLWPRMSHRCV